MSTLDTQPCLPGAEADLATLVDRGWDLHADQPRAVAAALLARAGSFGGDSAAGDAIGLAEHVLIGHLDDSAALAQFLAALPADLPPTAHGPLARSQWLLATLAGQTAAPVDQALRWRACQNLFAAWMARGRAGDALDLVRADLPQALGHPDPATRRALAASCNNTAIELRLGPRGDAQVDALMLACADASRQLWATAGNWVNLERAEYQLSRCHAVLGQVQPALAHARACATIVEAHAGEPQADAFERFFPPEALAWALHWAGDGAGARVQRDAMAVLLPAIADAALRAYAAQCLAAVDAALG